MVQSGSLRVNTRHEVGVKYIGFKRVQHNGVKHANAVTPVESSEKGAAHILGPGL